MIYQQLKQGTFRWRKKFRYLPTREQIVQELGIDWLANRLYGIIYKHISCGGSLQMLRVQEWEFVYIIHITMHFTQLEIIQRESLYIIPPSSISYASPVAKKFSISSITYGDAQSIIPTTLIPFLSAHSFAMFAKFKDLAAVIFIGLLFSLLPMCTCKSTNISYIFSYIS